MTREGAAEPSPSQRLLLQRRAQELARPAETGRATGHDVLNFTVDRRRYALPVAELVQVVPGMPVARVPLSPPSLLGVMNLRGSLLSVFELRDTPPDRPAGYRPAWVVVVTEDLGLAVDAVTGISSLDPDELTDPPAAAPDATGHPVAGLTADGTTVLAAARLASWDRFRPYAEPTAERPTGHP